MPWTFGSTVKPSGTCACTRLRSGSGRPRRAKRSSIIAITDGSWWRPRPKCSATVSRVRSSCVGPRPPETSTTSESSSASASAARMSAERSPTQSSRRTGTPRSERRCPSHEALVLTTCPMSSSSPMASRVAVMEKRSGVAVLDADERPERRLDAPTSHAVDGHRRRARCREHHGMASQRRIAAAPHVTRRGRPTTPSGRCATRAGQPQTSPGGRSRPPRRRRRRARAAAPGQRRTAWAAASSPYVNTATTAATSAPASRSAWTASSDELPVETRSSTTTIRCPAATRPSIRLPRRVPWGRLGRTPSAARGGRRRGRRADARRGRPGDHVHRHRGHERGERGGDAGARHHVGERKAVVGVDRRFQPRRPREGRLRTKRHRADAQQVAARGRGRANRQSSG